MPTRFIMKESWVWLTLAALTLFGFFNAETEARGAAYVVLAVGLVKFFLIFLDFMEMKHAHRVWKAAMALFMLAIVGAISISL